MFDDEKQIQIHFNECWDETIFIKEEEAQEWLDYLEMIIVDITHSVQYRLQKVVDSITKE